MAKTVSDETDEGLFGLRMPFGGFKEAAEAIQVECAIARMRPLNAAVFDAVCLTRNGVVRHTDSIKCDRSR